MVPLSVAEFRRLFFRLVGNRLSLLPTTWPGHSGDARIKLSRSFVITNTERLSPVIYDCKTRACGLPPWLPSCSRAEPTQKSSSERVGAGEPFTPKIRRGERRDVPLLWNEAFAITWRPVESVLLWSLPPTRAS